MPETCFEMFRVGGSALRVSSASVRAHLDVLCWSRQLRLENVLVHKPSTTRPALGRLQHQGKHVTWCKKHTSPFQGWIQSLCHILLAFQKWRENPLLVGRIQDVSLYCKKLSDFGRELWGVVSIFRRRRMVYAQASAVLVWFKSYDQGTRTKLIICGVPCSIHSTQRIDQGSSWQNRRALSGGKQQTQEHPVKTLFVNWKSRAITCSGSSC